MILTQMNSNLTAKMPNILKAESPFFNYQSLDNTKNEIRVVKLQNRASSPDSTDIICVLEHVSLDDKPHYVALSYVWGDPGRTYPIVLDGFKVQVTENMYQALLQLQRASDPYTLWVDALCINQTDNSERGTQVQLMTRIYSEAAQVFIWLGLEDEGSIVAIHQLRGLGQAFLKLRETPDFDSRIQLFVEFLLKDGSFRLNEIWKLIRQRPWWRRLWIIQEAILAQEAIMVCGNHSASWEYISTGLEVFEWMILCISSDLQYRDAFSTIADIYPNVVYFITASKQFKSGNRRGLELLDLLRWTSISDSIQSTDPRDRIYGLLGLLTEKEREKIPVDYSPSITCEEVLFVATKALVGQHGPNVLSFCQQTGLSAGLPSWVPDWTSKIRPTLGSVSPTLKHNYSASGTTVWEPITINATYYQPILPLRSVKVSQIVRTASEFKADPNTQTYLRDCKVWLVEIEELLLNHPCGSSDATNTAKQNIWRLPIADMSHGSRAREEEGFDHAWKVLTGAIHPPPERSEDPDQWVRNESWSYRRAWNNYFRRPFISMEGQPGIGPAHTQNGDVICIFLGGDIPFIIRDNGDGSYRLIGEAYVHGVMAGEAMEGDTVIETIKLR
jgi:hypothetical protein